MASDSIPPGLTLRWTLTGHTADIHRINWSPVGDKLVSPALDHSTRIWHEGKLIGTLQDSAAPAMAAAWSRDGEHLAHVARNDVLRLWNVAAGKSERTRTGGLGLVCCVQWSPDGKVVATGALNGTLRLWDAEFKNFREIVKKSNDKIFCLAFARTGSLLAAGFESGKVRVWNLESDEELATLAPEDAGGIYALAFARQSNALAAAGAKGAIYLLDPIESKTTGSMNGHTGAVHSVSFSHDDQLLASKSGDGSVRLWSTEIEEEMARLPEHPGETWLSGLAFHPAAPMLATLGDQARAIRVWDVDAEVILGG